MLHIGRVGVGLSSSEPTNLKHCQYLPNLPYSRSGPCIEISVYKKLLFILFSSKRSTTFPQNLPCWRGGYIVLTYDQWPYISHLLLGICLHFFKEISCLKFGKMWQFNVCVVCTKNFFPIWKLFGTFWNKDIILGAMNCRCRIYTLVLETGRDYTQMCIG